jgi:hypothetical protein
MDYCQIADKYGIKVHKVVKGDKYCLANGEDTYTNCSFSAGRDEIFIGVYDEKDKEIASFFHELGHCLSTNMEQFDSEELLKWHIELDAWMVGLIEAYKYKYLMQPSTFEYIIQCLNTYIPNIKNK